MKRLTFFCSGEGGSGRFCLPVLWLCLGFLFSGLLRADEKIGRPVKVTAVTTVTKGGEAWRYFLFLPAGYEKDETRQWPMILWLHGRSMRGKDLEQLRRYGPPSFLGKKPDFPFIVVCPQLPDGAWPSSGLNRLLDECLLEYRIDQDRIILTGDSLGAMGAWSLAASAPDRFAALTPVTAHGVVAKPQSLIRLPIRAWHGDADDAVPMDEHVALIKKIKALGGDAEIKIIPGGTHSSVIGMNWKDPQWLTWIETQRRKPE